MCVPVSVCLSVWLRLCLSLCLCLHLHLCQSLCLCLCLCVCVNVGVCICVSLSLSLSLWAKDFLARLDNHGKCVNCRRGKRLSCREADYTPNVYLAARLTRHPGQMCFLMIFALRYGGIRTCVGRNPRSPRSSALTTRPLVYIRLVSNGFPSHMMENHPVLIVYTRVAEWWGLRDQGLLPPWVWIPPCLNAKFITCSVP